MTNFFNKAEEARYKKDFIDMMMRELFNLRRENAFSVDIILDKQAHNKVIDKEIETLGAQLPQDEDKFKKDARDEYKEISQKIAGFQFMKTQNSKRIVALYDSLATSGSKIQSIEKNIIHARRLSLSHVPKLPYIEYNGTRYLAKDNMIVKDEKGIQILYVEPDKKQYDTTTNKV